jgi:hypothetical protein
MPSMISLMLRSAQGARLEAGTVICAANSPYPITSFTGSKAGTHFCDGDLSLPVRQEKRGALDRALSPPVLCHYGRIALAHHEIGPIVAGVISAARAYIRSSVIDSTQPSIWTVA